MSLSQLVPMSIKGLMLDPLIARQRFGFERRGAQCGSRLQSISIYFRK